MLKKQNNNNHCKFCQSVFGQGGCPSYDVLEEKSWKDITEEAEEEKEEEVKVATKPKKRGGLLSFIRKQVNSATSE